MVAVVAVVEQAGDHLQLFHHELGQRLVCQRMTSTKIAANKNASLSCGFEVGGAQRSQFPSPPVSVN